MLCDEDCVTIVAELAEHAASRAAATCKAVDVGVFEIQYLRSMYPGSRCPNSKQHPWLLARQAASTGLFLVVRTGAKGAVHNQVCLCD